MDLTDVQAAIAPYKLVVARLDDLTVGSDAAYANASKNYAAGDERSGLLLLFKAGATRNGLAALGITSGDYRLAMDALIGRGYILLGDFAAARPYIESALAEGEALQRTDAELSGVLRDLAWLAEKDGEAARAAELRARADVCPLACGTDLVWRVGLDAQAFGKEASAALGSDPAWRKIQAGLLADGAAFVDAHVPAGSLLDGKLKRYLAGMLPVSDSKRPDLLETAIAILTANGLADEALRTLRLNLIDYAAAAGQTARAAAVADALIAETNDGPIVDARVALDAAQRKSTALITSNDPGAAVAYREAVDLALHLMRRVDVGAADIRRQPLAQAGVAAGFDADALRLVDVLLAFEPGNKNLLQLRLTLAERAGDTVAAAQIEALITPTLTDERTRALARYGGDGAELTKTYPDVVPSFEWIEEDYQPGEDGFFQNYRLAGPAGAATIGLRDAGTEDDRIAADVVLARLFLVRGDLAEARRLLVGAWDRIRGSGRDNRTAATVLRDLARVERKLGNPSVAAGYESLAATCVLPCTDDLMARFAGDVEVALRAAEAFPEGVAAAARDSAAVDAVAVTETVYAAFPDLVAIVFEANAARFEETRPWQAIDLYQRVIDVKLASGDPDVDSSRLALAWLLLKANEFDRLVGFVDSFRANVPDGERAREFDRLRARALWHLQSPDARAAYAAIVATPEPPEGDLEVLMDLLDARYDDLIETYANRMLAAGSNDEKARLALARLAADRQDFSGAADLLAAVAAPSVITRLQHAYFLEAAGRTAEAATIRAGLNLDAWVSQGPSWGVYQALDDMLKYRDFGAYEGAAEGARLIADQYEAGSGILSAATYRDAQYLWQVAFTLARGGDADRAFALMRTAASLAARLSFAEAGGADGGSLQLLRRDRYRYLLFVDIAWAWTTGIPPQRMSMSSRY